MSDPTPGRVAAAPDPGMHGIAGWDGSTAGARALQQQLAAQVVLRDGFAKPLRTIAGFDVGQASGRMSLRAAAVVLDARDLSLLEARVVVVPAPMPYVPGLLSFRELPALLQVLAMLDARPDLALVDGLGIAHPRGFGVACHFGLATGIPSIGVAKKAWVGSAAPLHQVRGAYTPLREDGRQIGWLLRTRAQCQPMVVSPGHGVAMASAADLVMRCVAGYRLPEPTRLADRLASQRGTLDAPVQDAD